MKKQPHTLVIAMLTATIWLFVQSCSVGSAPKMNRWPHQVFPIDNTKTAYIFYSSELDYAWGLTLVLDENGKRYTFDLNKLNLIGDIVNFHDDTIFLMLHTLHEPFSHDTTIVMNCGTLHGEKDYTVMQTVHHHLDGAGVHCPYAGEKTKDYKYLVDRITVNKKENKAILWYKMNIITVIDIDKLHYNDRDGCNVFNQCIIDTTPGHRSIYRDDFGVTSEWVTFQPTSDSVIENYFNSLIQSTI